MSYDTNIPRRKSPYIELEAASCEPVRAAGKLRSPYVDEAKDKLTWNTKHPKISHVRINLKATELDWRERYELVSLRTNEAVSRILWLAEDAIIVFKPGAEFGEAQTFPKLGAFYDFISSVKLPHISLRRKLAKNVAIYLGMVLLVFAFFNLPGSLTRPSTPSTRPR